MNDHSNSLPWKPLGAEMIGTALLVAVGLSIFDFGRDSLLVQMLPGESSRGLVTGFFVGTTGALITLSLKRYTPALFPPLYAIMVWLEASVSGTSTKPARSLGPAVISGDWHGLWIYWLGSLIGTLVAAAAYMWAGWECRMIEVAKIYHFDHDPHGIFRNRTAAR
jgi:glycerol uptake facilitator-like aquaporin